MILGPNWPGHATVHADDKAYPHTIPVDGFKLR